MHFRRRASNRSQKSENISVLLYPPVRNFLAHFHDSVFCLCVPRFIHFSIEIKAPDVQSQSAPVQVRPTGSTRDIILILTDPHPERQITFQFPVRHGESPLKAGQLPRLWVM